MTKTEEIDTFRRFVDSLPTASYLRPMMEGMQIEVERAISNDVAFVDWPEIIRAQAAHEETRKTMAREVAEAKKELAALLKKREQIEAQMAEARAIALRIFQSK